MIEIDPGSFRDASNFIFYHRGSVFRAISHTYKEDYEALASSGFFDYLQERKYIIPHDEVDIGELKNLKGWYKTLKPTQLPFLSYPYEWSFSQFKDSALITLDLCLEALERDFILKDASAFNIQSHEGTCLLIDTTSFVRYVEGQPWYAYRQFVTHFLAPLMLMSKVSPSLNVLLRIHTDGIPLQLSKSCFLRYRFLVLVLCFTSIFMSSLRKKIKIATLSTADFP